MNSLISISSGRILFVQISSHNFEFQPFPELLLQHQGLSEQFNVFFSGDPNKILKNFEGDGEGGDGNENPDPENAEEKK